MYECLPFKFLTIVSYSTGFGFLIAKLASCTLHIYEACETTIFCFEEEKLVGKLGSTVNFVSGQEVGLACTASYRVGDMLGWAITCSLSIRFILAAFYGYIKRCSDWGRRVKGSSFTNAACQTLDIIACQQRD